MLQTAEKYDTHSPLGGGFCMDGHVYQDKKTGHWYIQIQWNKKTEKFFTYEYKGFWFPFESKGHANKILSRIQDDIDHKSFVPAAYRKNSPLSIATYCKTWLAASGICRNTSKGYRGAIKKISELKDDEGNYIFGPEFDIRDFTLMHSRLLITKNILSKTLSNDAVYNVMGALKTMLNFYRCDDPAFIVPVFPPMSKSEREEVEFLTFEDQQTILSAIPERHRPIFQFAMEFGVRPQEVTALRWDCITETHVTFRRSHSEYELRETTKTGDKGIRTEVLSTRAKEALQNAKKWPSFKGWVFGHNDRGSHYDNKIMNKIWKAACQQTGFRVPLYESIRHSWGCQLAEMGLSDDQIMVAYKHTSTKTTRKYAKRKRAFVADAIENRGNVYQFKKTENQ